MLALLQKTTEGQALLALLQTARESRGMITIVAAAALVATLHARPKRKRRPVAPRQNPIAAERVVRRRIVQLAVIAQLTRRETELEDFLALTKTETPLVRVDKTTMLGDVEIGPSTVSVDFLGSPIVRASIRNHSRLQFAGILTAHLSYGVGKEIEVSYALDALAPGETRAFEILYPAAISPTNLRWTLQPW